MDELSSKSATGIYYVLGTVLFTVYGQVIVKWSVSKYGDLPVETQDKLFFLLRLFFDPFILSGLFSAFIAALFWMAAMTKLDLSYAYPFMSLSFVLVFILSFLLFGEPVSYQKLIGLVLIILGVVITGRSL